MLESLLGRLSDRRCRLFACACSRRVLHLLSCAGGARAVEAGELYADGRATREELRAAEQAAGQAGKDAHAAYLSSSPRDHRHFVDHAAATACTWAATCPDGYAGDDYVSCNAVDAAAYTAAVQAYQACGSTQDDDCLKHHKSQEYARQADLLRDIIGNPFRPTPSPAPAVLAWRDRLIPRLAEDAYEERRLPEGTLDPARLGILADALLDAGCADDDLLAHLRSDGPHVRGCHGLDAVLGRS
jgi:hypothetical protein